MHIHALITNQQNRYWILVITIIMMYQLSNRAQISIWSRNIIALPLSFFLSSDTESINS